jgi:hypothetical protein
VYEFGTPFDVTYPMWYDISYWYEGVRPRFDLRDQLRRLRMSAARFVTMLTANRYDAAHFNPQPLLLSILLVAWLASPRPWARWQLAGSLVVSSAGILLLYAAVRVTPRYVGAALLVIWITLLAGVRFRSAARTGRVLRLATIAASVVLIAASVTVVINEAGAGWQRMLRGEQDERNVPWETASVLREHGVREGTRIGIIGNAQLASRWARLARVRIVAEMPAADAAHLADFTAATVASVVAAFRRTPASVLLIEATAPVAAEHGWTVVEGTPYAVIPLDPSP